MPGRNSMPLSTNLPREPMSLLYFLKAITGFTAAAITARKFTFVWWQKERPSLNSRARPIGICFWARALGVGVWDM